MRKLVVIGAVLLGAAAGWAQEDLKFEVASVRMSPPTPKGPNGPFTRRTGGPGTKDPEHLRYSTASMVELLTRAFQAQIDQFVGPDWAKNMDAPDRYEIEANARPGATAEQVNAMMQNLLKERFRLAYHIEKRDLDAYELVAAKGGPKVKDAEIPAEMPKVPSGQPLKTNPGEDGYPNMPAGWPMVTAAGSSGFQLFMSTDAFGKGFSLVTPQLSAGLQTAGTIRFTMRMVTMPQFVGVIQNVSGFAHVVDHTGLTGKYDIKLGFAMGGSDAGKADGAASEPAPDIYGALEKQLGLQLKKTKAPLDVIVIDHIERTPTEN